MSRQNIGVSFSGKFYPTSSGKKKRTLEVRSAGGVCDALLLCILATSTNSVPLIRNRKSDRGWVSYLGEGACNTNFSIIAPDFLSSCKSQPDLLLFCPVLVVPSALTSV